MTTSSSPNLELLAPFLYLIAPRGRPGLLRQLERACEHLRADPGNHLTLDLIGSNRSATRLARLDASAGMDPVVWLVQQLEAIRAQQGDIRVKIRLRLWNRGGKPRGSATFELTPDPSAQPVPPPTPIDPSEPPPSATVPDTPPPPAPEALPPAPPAPPPCPTCETLRADLERTRADLDAARDAHRELQLQHHEERITHRSLQQHHDALLRDHRPLRDAHRGLRADHRPLRDAPRPPPASHRTLRQNHRTLETQARDLRDQLRQRDQDARDLRDQHARKVSSLRQRIRELHQRLADQDAETAEAIDELAADLFPGTAFDDDDDE